MNDSIEKKLMDLTKIKTTQKVIILTLIVSLIFLFSFFIFLSAKPEKEAIYAIEASNENEYVYMDVSFLTDCFAQYETNSYQDDYYFIGDDDYLVIAKLSKSNFESLKDINSYTYGDIDTKPANARITGMTKTIPDELKKLALEYYNKLYPNNVQTTDTIENYIGNYYIDTEDTPMSDVFDTIIILFIVFFITLVILVLIQIINKVKSKNQVAILKSNNELEKISLEYDLSDKEIFEKQKVILLNSYIIDYSGFLKVIKYSDIIWLYIFIQRINGIESTKDINILTNSKKRYNICLQSAIGKDQVILNEIFEKIIKRCPNALVGYTNENITKLNKKNIESTINEINEKNTP